MENPRIKNILSRSFLFNDSAALLVKNYRNTESYIHYYSQYSSYLQTYDFKKYTNDVDSICKILLDTIRNKPAYNFFLPLIYENIAQVYRYKDSTLYFSYLDSAEKYIPILPSDHLRIITGNRGFWYTENGHPQKAVFHLNQCVDEIYKNDTLEKQTLNACYYYLTYAYSEYPKFEEATNAAINFIELNDELQKEKAIYDFYNMDFTDQLMAKDNEIKKTSELLEGQTKLNIALVVIISLLAFILIIFTHFFKKLKKSKEVLAEQIEENRKLQKQKDEIYAVLAHDIKSPITEQLMQSSLLFKQTQASDSLKESFSSLERSNMHLLMLVDNILVWSRNNNPISRKENIEIDTFYFTYILPYLQIFENQNRRYHIQKEDGLMIHTNLHQFSIVVRNMLDNALKHSIPQSDITIKLFSKNNVEIHFQVINSTSASENLNNYTQFINDENVNEEMTNRLGLGSLMIKKISKSMNYRVNIETENNQVCTELVVRA